MPQILIFGASITYGAWDKNGGWVWRLRKHLDESTLKGKNYNLIYNLGVSGDTSKQILKRFESETKARIDREEETIIIFLLGNNDSIISDTTTQNNVSKKEFEKNIFSLIKKAKKYSKKIIFISPPPVDGSKLNPIPWMPGYSYSNSEISLYCKIMENICQNQNVIYFDIYDILTKNKYLENLADGIHPTDAGHEQLFMTIKYLSEKNGII